MQLNNMPNHQPSAGGTEPLVDSPAIRLVSGSVPVSIPLYRLRNMDFLRTQVQPVVEPEPNGSATNNNNNNNYDYYKPSAANGLELISSTGDEPAGIDKADHAKIKLETSDGESAEGFNGGRPASIYGSQDSQSPSPPPSRPPPSSASSSSLAALQALHSARGRMEEELEEEEAEQDGDEEEEQERNMMIDEPEDESNDTGAVDMDDSEQDDNKLAPQDQEKMTQAVKKVFTEYKWTPPVAPISNKDEKITQSQCGADVWDRSCAAFLIDCRLRHKAP
uniref:Uncharacterized protein n=1 Tax=Anopheles culicifacies TaxID=139723 RepID=A0A182LSV5_9DIPT